MILENADLQTISTDLKTLIVLRKNVWTMKDLAIYLGVTIQRVKILTNANKLPYYKQGRKVFYNRAEVEQWQMQQKAN